MRYQLTTILGLTVFPTVFLTNCKQEQEQEQKPNVLLILIDDMGWKDVGYAGSNYYETPNIDSLPAQYLVFTNGYSSAPVSSPSGMRC
ncbi:MAG: sulfatase-like hydrolase/transferase [Bacteroidota bacterium]